LVSDIDIVRAGHIEILVTDLDRARRFYVDTLGFIMTESDKTHCYLRGLEDRTLRGWGTSLSG
jgi:catechol 2,3-dioxygenase